MKTDFDSCNSGIVFVGVTEPGCPGTSMSQSSGAARFIAVTRTDAYLVNLNF